MILSRAVCGLLFFSNVSSQTSDLDWNKELALVKSYRQGSPCSSEILVLPPSLLPSLHYPDLALSPFLRGESLDAEVRVQGDPHYAAPAPKTYVWVRRVTASCLHFCSGLDPPLSGVPAACVCVCLYLRWLCVCYVQLGWRKGGREGEPLPTSSYPDLYNNSLSQGLCLPEGQVHCGSDCVASSQGQWARRRKNIWTVRIVGGEGGKEKGRSDWKKWCFGSASLWEMSVSLFYCSIKVWPVCQVITCLYKQCVREKEVEKRGGEMGKEKETFGQPHIPYTDSMLNKKGKHFCDWTITQRGQAHNMDTQERVNHREMSTEKQGKGVGLSCLLGCQRPCMSIVWYWLLATIVICY